MSVDKVFGHFRTFARPDEVRADRAEKSGERAAYQALVRVAKARIGSWRDPNSAPYSRVETHSRGAAVRLIETLRADGYAADFHWHGTDDRVVVQFALAEEQLQRAHHDPRHGSACSSPYRRRS
jgi:hypothetical protein